MADETRLVAVFDANLLGFTKGMAEAHRISDKFFGDLQTKMQQTERALAGGFKGLNLGGDLARFLSVAAIEEFSRHVLTMTAGLVDTARVANVTVESLQAFREAMKDAGGSAEDADTLLKKLNVTVGAAKLGVAAATDVFAHLKLGPSDLEGTGEEVLKRVAQALLAIKDPTIRAKLETEAFSRSGIEFERVLVRVAGGLDKVADGLRTQNRLISDDTAEKAKEAVLELEGAWSHLITATAPGIIKLTTLIADLATAVSDLSEAGPKGGTFPWARALEGAAIGGALGSVTGPGAIGGAAIGGVAGIIHGLLNPSQPSVGTFADSVKVTPQIVGRPTGGPRFQTTEEIAAAKKAAEEALRFLKELNQASNQFLSNWDKDFKQAFEDAQKFSRQSINQTRDDLAAANDQRGLAEHETQAARLIGTEAFFNAQRTLALESLNVQIAAIERAKFAEKTALDDRGTHWAGYEQARSNVEQKANAEIATAREGFQQKLLQIEEDQTHKLRDSISLADTLRDSFNLIGAAGVQNFHSIGDAVKQAAQQLAAAVFQLTVMKPLLDSLTGQAGTPFGGILGRFFDSLSGGGFGFPDSVDITPGRFASGGRPPMNRWSIVGENGPEWFKPDTAGIVIPSANGRAGGMNLTIQNVVQLAGANGDATIREYARRGAVEGAALAVSHIKKNFPAMMVTATQRSL